jgi:hypothetical protein
MANIQELLKGAAGSSSSSFGVTDVFLRARERRRRRIAALIAVGSLAVACLLWVGANDLAQFSTERNPIGPADPPRGEAVLIYSSEGDLFMMSGPGDEPRNITNTPIEELNPAISPDGKTVVFERIGGPDSATNWALHSMPVSGGDSSRLTDGSRESGYDRMPAWSPQGDRIAFVRHRAQGSEILGADSAIVIMNADGSAQLEVTERPATASSPTWLSDGSMVLYSTVRGENPWVAAVDSSDGDQTFLAPGSVPEPHGSNRFAFLRMVRPFITDAFSMSVSGGGERRLTRNRLLTDLVAFGDGGLAAAEAESREGAANPLVPRSIIILEGTEHWSGRVDGIPDLQGFAIMVPR